MSLPKLTMVLKHMAGKHDQSTHNPHTGSELTIAKYKKLAGRQSKEINTVKPLPAGIEEDSDEFFDWLFGAGNQQHIGQAIKDYSHESYKLNQALRKGQTLDERSAAISQGLDDGFNMQSSRTDEDYTVYRGLPSAVVAGVDQFTDVAYSSVTATESSAANFGNPIKVRIPSGSRVLAGGYSEQELILPRNTTYVKQGDEWVVDTN